MIKKLAYWFLANAVLPILLPVICVAGYDWFVQKDSGIGALLPQLWAVFLTFTSQGYYIFSALTLILSLFENYDELKRCTTIMDGVILTVFGILTMIVFYMQYRDVEFLQNHLWKFLCVWVILALYAFKLKIAILLNPKTIRRTRLWNLTPS